MVDLMFLASAVPVVPPAVLPDPSRTPMDLLPGLALSLAIGLLVGIERGWAMRSEQPGERVAGVRTFSLLGLFGGWLGLDVGGPLEGLSLVLAGGVMLALLLGYAIDMNRSGNVSATSTIAAMFTLALGAAATAGYPALASVGAGATIALLASRKAMHAALDETSEVEIKALIRLALVIFVVLPLLPDVGFGPYGLNPRRLWFVVVTCGAISFVGYALSRWLGGRRAALVTALVGALVSSTAVTLEGARRIRESGPDAAQDAAIVLAQSVMMARALFLVAVLAPFILAPLTGLVLPGLILALLIGGGLYWRSRAAPVDPNPAAVTPPGLGLALLFAATVAVVSTLAGWAQQRFGAESAATVVALGGLADIDSAIASLATMPPGTIPVRLAGYAIAAPVLFNTLLKLGIVLTVAGWRRAPLAAAGLAVPALAIAAAAALSIA